MDRFIALVFTFAVVVFFAMTYDNVWSDLAPIQALAEAESCRLHDCKEAHGLTRVDRNSLGQAFEFTWKSTRFTVHCQRAWYAFGERTCSAR